MTSGFPPGGEVCALDRAPLNDAGQRSRPPAARARGPGLITQRVDHPACGLLPFANRKGMRSSLPSRRQIAIVEARLRSWRNV
jgi:hypothetical protein